MIDFIKRENSLFVKLKGDFNYPAVKKLEKIIETDSVDSISIELSGAKVVDSEAVKFIFLLDREGKQVTLINPPYIFSRVVSILGLDKMFKNLKIVKEGD
ncbi:hypothetical protein [Persephonella sp.]